MKHILSSIRITAFFLILCGLIYPALMTTFAQLLFHDSANGSFISRGGQLIGSELISQNFEKPEYFWSRPSAVSHNPLPSGGSNYGATSESLKVLVDARKSNLEKTNSGGDEVPTHLLFASSSGLDPHITVAAAEYQLQRVARARSMPIEQVKQLLSTQTKERQFGFLGEQVVNVLALNLSLDKLQGIETAPVLAPETEKTKAMPIEAPVIEENNIPASEGK